MKVTGSNEFIGWFERIRKAATSKEASAEDIEAWVQVRAGLQALKELTDVPIEDVLTIRRVIRARRHRLWRVRPEGDPAVQVRLIVWFRGDRAMVVYGGNKAELQELWYEHAIATAEAIVDREVRQDGGRFSPPSS